MPRWNKRRRLLFRWTCVSVAIVAATLVVTWLTRTPDDDEVLPGERVNGLTSILSTTAQSKPSPIRFQDITAESGIRFRHFPRQRSSQLPEDMGSGVAVGDYDGDGRPDLFFVNFSGNVTPGAPMDSADGKARLYRNLGDGRFEDVTDSAGVGYVGYGMGAAWGDYDNDGDQDLYITAFGKNALYRNRGDGTFDEVTTKAGVGDGRFSAGCAWADYDRDGDLDLYVCNYVDYVYRESANKLRKLQYSSEQPFTLNPSAYAPLPNALYRNNGDGTFENVAESAGVMDPTGRSLSASWVDFDSDGWLDLYVANDVSNNGVFRNRRDGTFEDIGPASLAADYRGAMGVAVADFDDDLDQDLLITHWIAQENALFRNMARDKVLGASSSDHVWFMDEADVFGLGQVSLDMVGWATGFCDFDNDGRRDLWIVNGSTLEQTGNHRLLEPQPSFLFWNAPNDRFVDVTAQASPRLATPFVGRGGAQVDWNGDGLVDLVIVTSGGAPILLKNTSPAAGHWLRLQLAQAMTDTRGVANRHGVITTPAIGTVAYVTAAGQTQMAAVGASASYLSQGERTLHFGLGAADRVDTLRIVWPDGAEDIHPDLPVDRVLSFTHAARQRQGRFAAHSLPLTTTEGPRVHPHVPRGPQ